MDLTRSREADLRVGTGMMENKTEKRINYRRYEDRRVAMMLAIHEILFDQSPGTSRDRNILAALAENYQVERVALISVLPGDNGAQTGAVTASFGDWRRTDTEVRMHGVGFEKIAVLHRTAEGALSFESVRKPELFSDFEWRSLWEEGIGAPARALLSIAVGDDVRTLLWLQQTTSTREWSSRDRDLIEEVAGLLSKAGRRGV